MDSEKKEESKEEQSEGNKEPKEEHVDKIEEDNNKDKEEQKNEENKEDDKEEEEDEKEEKEEKDEKEEKEEKDEKEDKKEKKKKKKKEKKKKEKKEKENKGKKKKKEKINLILAIDEENNKCADCENSNPTKISINNGIVICESCAERHLLLGPSISYIKNIDDDLDEYLLNFLVFGSNSKFKRFLISEQVDLSLPIEKKYITKACYFYRKNLKKKVKGENIETEKNYEKGDDPMEEGGENDFEEFENYKIKSKVIHEGSLKSKDNINTKLNKLGGSILSVGKKMFGGIKLGANYVEKKLEGPSKNIIKGAGNIGKKIGNTYEKIKNNFIKGKNKENKDDKDDKDNKEEMKNDPPNINNIDIGETGRPLQAGEGKEENSNENNEQKKEEKKDDIDNDNKEDKKEEKEEQKQEEDNNEEKIDA